MMLIEVTVRYIEDEGRKETQTTRVYAAPPDKEHVTVGTLWPMLESIAFPLLEHGGVEVFETGHEPWDRVYDVAMPNLAVHWCAEHTRYEVAT